MSVEHGYQFLQEGRLHVADAGVLVGIADSGHTERSLRLIELRRRLRADGVNISAWARDNGFSPKLVHQVLRGGRSCNFGESHRIAVKLGLKDAPQHEPLLEAAE